MGQFRKSPEKSGKIRKPTKKSEPKRARKNPEKSGKIRNPDIFPDPEKYPEKSGNISFQAVPGTLIGGEWGRPRGQGVPTKHLEDHLEDMCRMVD